MHSLKEILSSSFENNFSIIYAVGTNQIRRDNLIAYSIYLAERSGKIYHKESSAALIIFRNKKPSFVKNLIPTLKLIFRSLGANTFKISRKEKIVESIHSLYNVPEEAVYLWYIGTHPSRQGEGLGSQLLSEITQEFHNKTIVLETSVESNVKWYQKFGFSVYHEENFAGTKFYFLRKEPVKG